MQVLNVSKQLSRGVGTEPALHPNPFYVLNGTESQNQDTEYDEGDPQLLVHKASQYGSE